VCVCACACVRQTESLGQYIAVACPILRHIQTFSAGWSRPRAPPPTDLFPRLCRAGAGTALLVCRQPDCSGEPHAAAFPQIFLFEPRDYQEIRVNKTNEDLCLCQP
jgi:hypothetical protein